ncbi:MAG: CPBP family intramembrane metalloprotease [Clostridia bacterium]|nr:CPBP family intramembrane metalloprotease [Clostridia bacterium]
MNNQYAPYGTLEVGPSTPMSKATRNEILKVSGILGLCILMFYGLSEFSGRMLATLVNAGAFDYNFTTQNIIQILYTLLTILVPFAIGAFFIKRVQKRDTLLLLDKPKSGILLVEAVGIGLLAIVVANVVTAGIVRFFEVNGVVFDSYKPESPTTGYQFAWMLLSNAIVPALVEEFALRGVFLQSLRKYGDAFAVFASAILFGIMHGNMTQAPFAFMLGAVLAILVIVTGSLWTSMLIHLINNTYSVIMTTLLEHSDATVTAMATVSFNTLFSIYGAIALVYLFGMHHGRDLIKARYQPGGPALEGIRLYRRQAWLYTLVSPSMLVALILLLVELFKTVHLAE